MTERETAQLLSLARTVVGTLLFLAPGKSLAGWTGERNPTRREKLIMRGLGARDAAIGLGALIALDEGDASRWLETGALGDAADALATIAAFPELPPFRRWLWLGVSAGSALLSLQLAEALAEES